MDASAALSAPFAVLWIGPHRTLVTSAPPSAGSLSLSYDCAAQTAAAPPAVPIGTLTVLAPPLPPAKEDVFR